jgi:hypothetical protein
VHCCRALHCSTIMPCACCAVPCACCAVLCRAVPMLCRATPRQALHWHWIWLSEPARPPAALLPPSLPPFLHVTLPATVPACYSACLLACPSLYRAAMITMFEKMGHAETREGGDRTFKFLRTHPHSSDRSASCALCPPAVPVVPLRCQLSPQGQHWVAGYTRDMGYWLDFSGVCACAACVRFLCARLRGHAL